MIGTHDILLHPWWMIKKYIRVSLVNSYISREGKYMKANSSSPRLEQVDYLEDNHRDLVRKLNKEI